MACGESVGTTKPGAGEITTTVAVWPASVGPLVGAEVSADRLGADCAGRFGAWKVPVFVPLASFSNNTTLLLIVRALAGDVEPVIARRGRGAGLQFGRQHVGVIHRVFG